MPLYEFSCRACHHRFTELLAYKDKGGCVCPECGDPDVVEHLGGFSSPARSVTGSPMAGTAPGCDGCGSAGSGLG